VLLRALCPTEAGELEDLGDDQPFWEALRAAFVAWSSEAPAGGGGTDAGSEDRPDRGSAVVEDRRREGFAGVAGDLFSSGEAVLVAVADVPRRRAGLEAVVAGLAGGPMPVASWTALAGRPELAEGFAHLVALDPPPGGLADPLLSATPRAHLAWGPAEADFAIAAYRAALDLRPQLAEAYRALRELPADASPAALETALRGTGSYPRAPSACARLLEVLTELGLIELDLDAPCCGILEAVRGDLELSATYRTSREQLEAIEQALAPELPQAVPASAAG
jgi:single-stranded-DNA-specific exonuclease